MMIAPQTGTGNLDRVWGAQWRGGGVNGLCGDHAAMAALRRSFASTSSRQGGRGRSGAAGSEATHPRTRRFRLYGGFLIDFQTTTRTQHQRARPMDNLTGYDPSARAG